MLGFSAFERNKKLLKHHGVAYSRTQHAQYNAALKQDNLVPMSVQKCMDDENAKQKMATIMDLPMSGILEPYRRVGHYVDVLNRVTGSNLKPDYNLKDVVPLLRIIQRPAKAVFDYKVFEENKKFLESHDFSYNEEQHWKNEERLGKLNLPLRSIPDVGKQVLRDMRAACDVYMKDARHDAGPVYDAVESESKIMKQYMSSLGGYDLVPIIEVNLPLKPEEKPYMLDVHIVPLRVAMEKFYHS